MAKKPTPTPQSKATPVNDLVVAKERQAINTLAVIELSKQEYAQGRDLVNQLLGQAQMAGAFEEFSRTVRTSKLAVVKEAKLYQQLKGMKTPHGAELSGTWEDFCNLLGRSVDQVDRDIANVRAFGEEALDQMQRVGIGYRDLRQFRRLPSDQKSELIEAARAGDTATLLELAEDLIAKHAKDKADLQKDMAAKDQRIATYNTRIAALQEQVDAKAEAEATIEGALVSATAAGHEALSYVRGGLRQAFETLASMEDGGSTSHRGVMAGFVADLRLQLDILEGDFFLGKGQ